MGQIHGEQFTNTEVCRGTAFVGQDVELDVITINGRYPSDNEAVTWARNERSDLVAKAIKGSGRIAIRRVVGGEVRQELVSLQAGYGGHTEQAAHVPAGSWYAWESLNGESMTVVAGFSPPFHPDQYRVRTEQEINEEEVADEIQSQ